jgi:PAS domain-containing protein
VNLRGSRRADTPPAEATGLDPPAGAFAGGPDLAPATRVLAQHRQEILDQWLARAAEQPFHRARPVGAVADHIPRLFDALVDLLRTRGAGPPVAPPLDDPAVLVAADEHARARFAQGLGPTDVATELRLLRQEIWRALRRYLDRSVSSEDVLAAELVINDGLDSAVTTTLLALRAREEEHRQLRLELDARRAELAAIVDSSTDAIYAKMLDGIITSWNPAAERLYGYPAAEIVGQPVARLPKCAPSTPTSPRVARISRRSARNDAAQRGS